VLGCRDGRARFGAARRPALDQNDEEQESNRKGGETAHETSLMEATLPVGGDAVAGPVVSRGVAAAIAVAVSCGSLPSTG
jgi:hypothetical protein